jgi:anti-anti-sigma factor
MPAGGSVRVLTGAYHQGMAVNSLSVDTDPLEDGVRLRLAGELDVATAPLAEDALRTAEAREPATLAIDLAGLTFMDSTGLRLVMAADTRAREAGRRLVVVRGPDAVQRVFELTGVDERIELVDGV